VKAYSLTRAGRAQLAEEKARWRKVQAAVNAVLA
jgi:DNA-binding PadR family transcriptional regulator